MYKVYLSPSTNKNEVGKKSYGFEQYRMKMVANIIEQELIKNGNIIVFKNMEDMSVEDIIEDSNASKADVHIAIHTRVENRSGVEIYVNENNVFSQALGREINKKLKEISYIKEGKMIYTSKKIEIVEVIAPSAIIYLGSRQNQKDVDGIIENNDSIGQKIAEGIEEYFKLKKC